MDAVGTVRERDEQWNRALRAGDLTHITDFLDDDYALVLVFPTQLTVSRAEWLRMLPHYVISQWDVQQSVWDVQGDSAAHLQLVDQRALVMGKRRDGLFAVTDVWLRIETSWRVWRRHSTPLTAGEMPRA